MGDPKNDFTLQVAAEIKKKAKTWLKILNPLDMIIYTNGLQGTDQTGTPIRPALVGSSFRWIVNIVGVEYL